jgi:hypothetical protein
VSAYIGKAAWFLVAALAAASAATTSAQADVLERASASMVRVESWWPVPEGMEPQLLQRTMGVVVGPGQVATTCHAIAGGHGFRVVHGEHAHDAHVTNVGIRPQRCISKR